MTRQVEREVEGCIFTWDAEKARTNLNKHEVAFTEALEVLFDPNYRAEDAGVEEETRYAVIGYSDKNRLLYVVVSDAGEEAWRIISARPVTPRERDRYEEETDSA